jgi:hypothetical protein
VETYGVHPSYLHLRSVCAQLLIDLRNQGVFYRERLNRLEDDTNGEVATEGFS